MFNKYHFSKNTKKVFYITLYSNSQFKHNRYQYSVRGLKKRNVVKYLICSHTSQVCLFDADSCSSEFEISKFVASLFLWPFVVRAWRATTHKTFNMINFLKVNNKIWIKMLRKKILFENDTCLEIYHIFSWKHGFCANVYMGFVML